MIVIRIINSGRRSITLVMEGGFYRDPHSAKEWWGGTFISHPKGVRLEPHETREIRLTVADIQISGLLLSGDDHDSRLVEVGYEDTLGRRYVVKKSRKMLKALWAAK